MYRIIHVYYVICIGYYRVVWIVCAYDMDIIWIQRILSKDEQCTIASKYTWLYDYMDSKCPVIWTVDHCVLLWIVLWKIDHGYWKVLWIVNRVIWIVHVSIL